MADMDNTLEPLTRESTVSIIAGRLRAAIAEGGFPPGAQLAEVELAKQLQVSRGPLREAMQRLFQEGLLRGERNRGLFVPVLGEVDVFDIYVARAAVERAAVERVLQRDDPELLAPLREAVDQMAEAAKREDNKLVADLDFEFHKRLVAASGSPRLVRMYGTLVVETRMCIGAAELTYDVPLDIVESHSLVLDAMASGKLPRAIAGIEAHIADFAERVLARLRQASEAERASASAS
jgi:DNA-binding GntR family transcriptional regulator